MIGSHRFAGLLAVGVFAGVGLTAAPAGSVSAGSAAAPPTPLPKNGTTYPSPQQLPPIPQQPGSAPEFTGHPVAGRPFHGFRPPKRNPYMAPNEKSNLHNDAYQTNASPRSGPSGARLHEVSAYLQEECASVTFDRRGQIVSVCVGAAGKTLDVFAARSLQLLASYPLPSKARTGTVGVTGGTSSSTFGGGGYFYLDEHDRAVVPTVDGRIAVLAISDSARPTITRDKVYDLRSAIADQTIESALPDWRGNLWFVTTGGVVGIARPSGDGAATVRLRTPRGGGSNAGKPENIGNSFAVDESGGVFVVSEEGLYRFDARHGRPRQTWRATYDRGRRIKPGMANFGSGTTPTLIHAARRGHGGLVAILDNADPDMHVDVFRRGRHRGGRKVCSVRVFTGHPRRNSDENNLISLHSRLWAENNYGAPGPVRVTNTTPGMQEVRLTRHGCRRGWESNAVRVPSVVSKVSAGSGLIYTYTHPRQQSDGSPEVWRLTAVDARSGKVRWSRLSGVGGLYNNYYAPVTLGPNGAIYVGALGGIVEFRGPLAKGRG